MQRKVCRQLMGSPKIPKDWQKRSAKLSPQRSKGLGIPLLTNCQHIWAFEESPIPISEIKRVPLFNILLGFSLFWFGSQIREGYHSKLPAPMFYGIIKLRFLASTIHLGYIHNTVRSHDDLNPPHFLWTYKTRNRSCSDPNNIHERCYIYAPVSYIYLHAYLPY